MSKLDVRCLSQCPQAIESIAAWYYAEWAHENPTSSPAVVLADVRRSLNTECLPITFVALVDGSAVGASQLKLREMQEYEQYKHWLGGVYVAPDHRGKGIAQALVKRCIVEATSRGLDQLYLQTQRLNGGLYALLGWKPVHLKERPDGPVRIMRLELVK